MKVIVTQTGARQHYNIAKGMLRKNSLKAFYTDYWAGDTVRFLGGRTGMRIFAKGAGRYDKELAVMPVSVVRSFWKHELVSRISRRRDYDFFIRRGRAFALGVNKKLKKADLKDGDTGFFGFTCDSLETMDFLSNEGVVTMLDQFDPARVEAQIIEEERRKWPGWEAGAEPISDAYFDRIAQEWDIASIVLVNSRWSKEALVKQGVPTGKIIVAPLCIDVNPDWSEDLQGQKYDGSRPLRILWLGSVILRKGIQYLLQAARLLGGSVEIKIAGPIGISEKIVRESPPNVTFCGHVPRLHAAKYFKWADVFILPTLSDGFAITQLEAMAHGIPVIATPRCGEVVVDNVNGLMIPPYDPKAIAEAIEKFRSDPKLLQEMPVNCRETAKKFTLDRETSLILGAMERYRQTRTPLVQNDRPQ